MAKLFPTRQTFVDEKLSNGEQIVVTRVTLVSSSSDFVSIPRADDAGLLHSSRTTADPTFYLTGAGTVFNIDGGTVGAEHVVVSRHSGMLNYDKGDNPSGGL
jgi:hypothetical protein